LNGESAKIRAAILEQNCVCGWKMVLQPREILVCSRRVHYEQKFHLANSINDQVIDDAATVVQEKGVLTRANVELADVIREHGVEPFACAWPLHDQLSHVRNIEDADIVSHGLVFLDDARVLDRHEPPGEGNHSPAEPSMFFVKRRFLWCLFAHAPN
jgi:hypothetical protein